MSTLENLTAKIIADSEAQAAAIISDARMEARRMEEDALAQAQREKEQILADAAVQAAREEQQLIVGGQLAVRDQNLAAKQQMLDQVFSQALSRLNAMGKDEFLDFVTGFLSTLDLDGETIVLPAKYGIDDISSINQALQKAGKKGNLVLDTSGRQIEGGFVLTKGGIEQNNTFESMVDYYRYELESDVLSALY